MFAKRYSYKNKVKTRHGYFATCCKSDQVILADNKGKIPNAEFTSLCTDNYGDLLVSDYNNNIICMLNEDASYSRIIVDCDKIHGPMHVDIDECG